jgi:hypothetical protein
MLCDELNEYTYIYITLISLTCMANSAARATDTYFRAKTNALSSHMEFT